MIVHAAPSRVGILGNPSDGYGGRTLSLAVPQFQATVSLEEADRVEIASLPTDEPIWSSIGAMTAAIDRHGYGTGPQLLAAAVRSFVDVAESIEAPLFAGGFRLSYTTTIPRQVGLGGSSALVVAALHCLSDHFGIEIPNRILPSVALRAETDQLGLAAGLQDRVVQTYGGLMAMDFSDLIVDNRYGVSHGVYEAEDPTSLPPLFLAYQESGAEPSDTYHQRLRSLVEAGDVQVREMLRELAGLVVEGRAALRWQDGDRFGSLIGRNMQLRRALGPIPASHLELIEVAESIGSQATFAGSGGAVVGTFDDGRHFEVLRNAYAGIGANIIGLRNQDCPANDSDPDTEADVVALLPRQRR